MFGFLVSKVLIQYTHISIDVIYSHSTQIMLKISPENPGRGASQTARAALSGSKLCISQNHHSDLLVGCLTSFVSST